jgi:hypothetical protein
MPTHDIDEWYRERISMSQKISKGDKDYAEYAGAPFIIGEEIATIKTAISCVPLPKEVIAMLKLRLHYLDQLRKAAFSGERADIVSILGFILGDTTRESDWERK